MSLATQLSPSERIDMIQKGLSPLNPDHIRSYFNNRGQINTSLQEKVERVQTLIGEDISSGRNLGSAKESERDYDKAYGNENSGLNKGGRSSIQDDLGSYGAPTRTIDSGSLMSLKKNKPQTRISENNSKDYRKIGYDLTIEYLNKFIINIKNPSAKGRFELFKSLKSILEYETKLKSNASLLQRFRNGCNEAETEMYEKISE